MDRITRQSPRLRGYGSTSSLRNDSLKHTRKHEKGREESNQETKHSSSSGPSGQEGRTVRMGLADRPACCRGLSAHTPRTVRPCTADRPLKRTEPPEPTRAKRTVREGQADRPLLKLGPSANRLQRKPKATPDRNETKQEHEEHRDELERHGLSAWSSWTVRQVRTEQKTHDPESQLPQIIIRFPKRLKLWRQGFGDLKSITQGCYIPNILPPNSLNHRESRIL
jgi:hypothetical protein